jgi:hypothetical protein
MNERPTPETDALSGNLLDANNELPEYFEFHKNGCFVDSDFARRLERERDEAREQVAAMREAINELQNIADAKPSTWGEMADQFLPWAQNRARHALAKLQPFLK